MIPKKDVAKSIGLVNILDIAGILRNHYGARSRKKVALTLPTTHGHSSLLCPCLIPWCSATNSCPHPSLWQRFSRRFIHSQKPNFFPSLWSTSFDSVLYYRNHTEKAASIPHVGDSLFSSHTLYFWHLCRHDLLGACLLLDIPFQSPLLILCTWIPKCQCLPGLTLRFFFSPISLIAKMISAWCLSYDSPPWWLPVARPFSYFRFSNCSLSDPISALASYFWVFSVSVNCITVNCPNQTLPLPPSQHLSLSVSPIKSILHCLSQRSLLQNMAIASTHLSKPVFHTEAWVSILKLMINLYINKDSNYQWFYFLYLAVVIKFRLHEGQQIAVGCDSYPFIHRSNKAPS